MKSEKYMVEKLRGGDKRAFRGFYNKTHKRLTSYVLGRVKNVRDAEEIVQDTYLSFLDSLPLFRGNSKLATFLFSIARHEVLDYWRKKYAKKAILTVPFVDQIYTEKLYSSALLNSEIERVYEKLSHEQVIILKLKYEEGFSLIQIAKRLMISVKTAESRLFRARKAFQEAYLSIQT
jgi:RNA polymerase sigma-70 factor (ECF subfamily)